MAGLECLPLSGWNDTVVEAAGISEGIDVVRHVQVPRSAMINTLADESVPGESR